MGIYTKEKVYELLDKKQIKYHLQNHKAVYTMEDVESAGVVREGIVLKNLFLKDAKGRNYFLVCVPEETKVDLKKLEMNLNVKHLGFVSFESLEKYLGVESGSVSPFGILNDENKVVIVVLDKNVDDKEVVGVHPNDSTASVWLKYQDIKRIIKDNGNEIIYFDFKE